MAVRPLAFGARFKEGDRSVRVQIDEGDPTRYVVEVRRAGGDEKRRDHPTLEQALRDFAASWRYRLH